MTIAAAAVMYPERDTGIAMKSDYIRARIEPGLKEETEAVLDEIGLSMSDAVTLFCRQMVLRRGLPFDVRIPNAETRAALMEDLSNAERFPDEEAMMKAIFSESN